MKNGVSMNNKMKVIIILCVIVVLTLTACAQTAECANCRAIKPCKHYKVELSGDIAYMWLCKDCREVLRNSGFKIK